MYAIYEFTVEVALGTSVLEDPPVRFWPKKESEKEDR